jgi:hypothetical protein
MALIEAKNPDTDGDWHIHCNRKGAPTVRGQDSQGQKALTVSSCNSMHAISDNEALP